MGPALQKTFFSKNVLFHIVLWCIVLSRIVFHGPALQKTWPISSFGHGTLESRYRPAADTRALQLPRTLRLSFLPSNHFFASEPRLPPYTTKRRPQKMKLSYPTAGTFWGGPGISRQSTTSSRSASLPLFGGESFASSRSFWPPRRAALRTKENLARPSSKL